MEETYFLCTDCLDVAPGEPFIVPVLKDNGADMMDERPVCTTCYQENHEKKWRDIG